MCSISVNRTVDEQIAELGHSGDKEMIERRLFNFANEADRNRSGPLDTPDKRMRRMPEDLRHIRKISIGRHRVYYTGHYRQCSYKAFYIKMFKKSGVDDDDTRKFQKILRQVLGEPSERNIIG